MIEENYYWQQHPLMLHDDIHIHECIDATSLSHLKSSCFPCFLFCSDFGRGCPFTYWMKEHMIYAHYRKFGAHSDSHLQKHPLLLYDDAHLHGCTYGIHLSHLETHAFPCSLSSPLDVGVIHPKFG